VQAEWRAFPAVPPPPPSAPVGYFRGTSYLETEGSQSLNRQLSVLLNRPHGVPGLAMNRFRIDYVTRTNMEPSWGSLLSCVIELWVVGLFHGWGSKVNTY
jgi:hypothetical protein